MKASSEKTVAAQIGVEWLKQYAQFLRRTPELARRLAEETSDFEFVPVPRELLDRLAVSGIAGAGGGVKAGNVPLLLVGTSTGESREPDAEIRAVVETLRMGL